jgi:hypothetical protein
MKAARRAGERDNSSEHLLSLGSYQALAATRHHGAPLGVGRRPDKRASNSIVMALMLATTGVAFFDLYLLGTGLPH